MAEKDNNKSKSNIPVDPRSKSGNPLNDKEEAFLCYISQGHDVERAFTMAGFTLNPGDNSRRQLMRKLSEEVVKDISAQMTFNAFKALRAQMSVLEDPSQPGANNLLAAANSVLDRAGIVKKDKLEIEHVTTNALVILPPKSQPKIIDVTKDSEE